MRFRNVVNSVILMGSLKRRKDVAMASDIDVVAKRSSCTDALVARASKTFDSAHTT